MLLVALLMQCPPRSACALLLLGTGDPAANATAPAGDLADSGWQYQGRFGDFLGTGPVPSRFYATRISNRTGWIYGVTDPTSDVDADGIPNLAEYGQHLDPAAADVSQVPQLGREANALTLIYRKRTTAADLQYVVEKSVDLSTWSDSAAQEQVISTSGTVQTIKATVPITGDRMFLRLGITRP